MSDQLATALAVRLGLQLGVSALPVVDEAMDAPLGRWLDSVPLPPDDPGGEDVVLEVSVASDLGRVSLAMHGAPGGVLPRLGPYLRQAGLVPGQEQVLDQLGGALAPARVGSFVAIDGDGLTTGWLFPTPLRLDAVAAAVPGVQASAARGWLAERGVAGCAGLWQAIGAAGYTDLVLAVPGASPGGALDAASDLFATVGGGELPRAVREAALVGEPPRVVVRLGGAPRVGLVLGGVGMLTLQQLGGALGIALDPGLDQLVATLGAPELSGVEYVVAAGRPELVARIAPSGAEQAAPGEPN